MNVLTTEHFCYVWLQTFSMVYTTCAPLTTEQTKREAIFEIWPSFASAFQLACAVKCLAARFILNVPATCDWLFIMTFIWVLTAH